MLRAVTTSTKALLALALLATPLRATADDEQVYYRDPAVLKRAYEDYRKPRDQWADSFYYYGPQDAWKTWTDGQRRGRDTWIFWTGGNQKFYRRLAVIGGGLGPASGSVDLFRMLDSRRRDERFESLGVINEPNCRKAERPDEFGLWLDVWDGDPLGYYPDPGFYGKPSGVVGIRLYPNPKFDREKWDAGRDAQGYPRGYFEAPGRVEPPYLAGITCALCHIAFDPLNPPRNVDRPRWDNLAANIGNQYFREGEFFLGKGRLLLGDQNPGPDYAKDPYDTQGLNQTSFLWHYAVTQQLGTSETSRISYDFINNPNTINAFFNVGGRPDFAEVTPDGSPHLVKHILKDGADSVGVYTALLRVWVNIGMEGAYWLDHLWSPFNGRRQKPVQLDEIRLRVPDDRIKELKAAYGEDFGEDWKETETRVADLLSYLASYAPMHLKDAPGGKEYLADAATIDRGAIVFADHCARCHSNKQPFYPMKDGDAQAFFRASARSSDFRAGNTLSDDRRYSVVELKTNMARALATNAVDGDIWAQFSSRDYKALPPLGRVRLDVPVDPMKPFTVDFIPPGGGRGYYRTASLVSMWATAPYLHNNSVGDYPDARELPMADWPTVRGRMIVFQDSVEKLLWPEKRDKTVKRTSTPSGLGIRLPALEEALPGLIKERLADAIQQTLIEAVDQQLRQRNIPAELAKALTEELREVIPRELKAIDEELKLEVAPLVEQKAVARVKAVVGGALERVLRERGVPNLVAGILRAKLDRALGEEVPKLKDLLAVKDMPIPAGTPVNLIMNLNVAAWPGALKAYVLYKDQPERLVRELVELSDCPDLVEDRGHEYGADLSEQDKRDLIEFLKTL